MIKDRDQKQKVLKLAASNRWFSQLEVAVEPGQLVGEKSSLVTDLDVLCSIPDEFKGYRSVVFDCKTGANESPVNRALWLAGILRLLKADQGFSILNKEHIELDHRLMATGMNVILLTENEFDLYSRATSQRYESQTGAVCDVAVWEKFVDIPVRFPRLKPAFEFLRSGFWMTKNSAEACRKTLAQLKNISPELDPSKPEHLALFFNLTAIFARSLAVVVCQIFKAYLQPVNQADLSEALLVLLYGGRDAYRHRNELFKILKSRNVDDQIQTDLSLPEWERFLQLFRQLLDAPQEIQHVPLILREVGLSVMSNAESEFAKILCSESSQGGRFAVLITDYLGRAAQLPPEFPKIADKLLLPLIPVK